MSAEREVVEEGRPLSESIIWPLLEQYFSDHGPSAWPETPHFPTSNAFVADVFADLLVAGLRDCLDRINPSEPVYILELGAGSGAFSLFCIRALEERRRHFAALAALDLRYVQTDFVESNLARWAEDEQLQRAQASGLLDSALFRPECDTSLTLLRSGVTIAPGTLKNPLLVIANYFFCVIRHDFFHTDQGALREARVRLTRSPTDAPPALDQFTVDYQDLDVDAAHYASPRWNALLAHYCEILPVGSVLMPVGALRTIDHLLELSGGDLMLLSIDKGWHGKGMMEGHQEVDYRPHTGSISFGVNFHALGRYFEDLGGQVWRAREHPVLTTFAAVSRHGNWENLDAAAHQFLQANDLPYNIHKLTDLLYQFEPRPDCDEAILLGVGLGLVGLARHDPWVFACCAPYLARGLPRGSPNEKNALRALLHEVEAQVSPLVVGCDSALYWLRELSLLLGDLDRCRALNERAAALLGPHADHEYFCGALAERREALADARRQYRKALALDAGHEPSLAAIKRLDRMPPALAEGLFAVGGGVVAWRDRAIVIPAAPGSGTSTLVRALVRRGACLYSDPWAVFDENGRVHAFDGDAGFEGLSAGNLPPLPVALMVSTVFQHGGKWNPEILTGTRALLQLLQQAPAMREQPAALLRLAKALGTGVVTLQSPRPDAEGVAAAILEFADDVINGRLERHTSVRRPGSTKRAALAAAKDPVPGPQGRLHKPAYFRIEDFLTAEAHRRVLDYALAHENEFSVSELYNVGEPAKIDPTFRKSRSLLDLDDEIWALFEPHLTRLLPQLRKDLGIPWFRLGNVERQLHVHREGDFFGQHCDNGEGDVETRRVSAVYYFHQLPKRYEGGALYLYDELDHGYWREVALSCTALEPLNNSLVFFPSGTYHEVQPVRLRDDAFSASRFTVTFWFCEDMNWQPTIVPPVKPQNSPA